MVQNGVGDLIRLRCAILAQDRFNAALLNLRSFLHLGGTYSIRKLLLQTCSASSFQDLRVTRRPRCGLSCLLRRQRLWIWRRVVVPRLLPFRPQRPQDLRTQALLLLPTGSLDTSLTLFWRLPWEKS